jgi:ABC-type lipopolysaccharide export system ATPase subunit
MLLDKPFKGLDPFSIRSTKDVIFCGTTAELLENDDVRGLYLGRTFIL